MEGRFWLRTGYVALPIMSLPHQRYLELDRPEFSSLYRTVPWGAQQKKARTLMRAFFKFGSPGQARTADLVINSHPLYRLSYRGIEAANHTVTRLLGQPVVPKTFSRRCRAVARFSMLVAKDRRM